MRFRTKVRELEAIKYDGTNKDAIDKLTGRVFAEVGGNDPYLIIKGGVVDVGDWVGVEDGKIKILGAAELEKDYTPVKEKK